MKRTFGGNRGYIGYSMSKRASQARAEGRFPKTDFKRMYGLTENVFKALEKLHVIGSGEWHHTSMYGNRTQFYGWTIDEYLSVYDTHEQEIRKLARGMKKHPNMMAYPATAEGMNQFDEDCKKVYQHNQGILDAIDAFFE